MDVLKKKRSPTRMKKARDTKLRKIQLKLVTLGKKCELVSCKCGGKSLPLNFKHGEKK